MPNPATPRADCPACREVGLCNGCVWGSFADDLEPWVQWFHAEFGHPAYGLQQQDMLHDGWRYAVEDHSDAEHWAYCHYAVHQTTGAVHRIRVTAPSRGAGMLDRQTFVRMVEMGFPAERAPFPLRPEDVDARWSTHLRTLVAA